MGRGKPWSCRKKPQAGGRHRMVNKMGWARAMQFLFPYGRNICLLLGLLASSVLLASAAQPAGKNQVTLNFVNADIEVVVKAVSQITGKNFIIDPRVRGTVTIVSANPMSSSLVYDVFLSALRLQGYTAVEDRGIVKIVPEADAKLHTGPIRGPDDKVGGVGDQIQTQVFSLKYESASQVLPILRPLIAPNNTITVSQDTNSLVITDYASNLQRLGKIIDSIDQPNTSDAVVIALTYASAVEVAQTVNQLFSESAGGGTASTDPVLRFTVLADNRSNALLVRSGDPSRIARVKKFVALLDSPTSVGGNIHVVYLKNAEAVKLAETLRGIYQGDSVSGVINATTVAAASTAASPLARASSGKSGQGSFGNGGSSPGASSSGAIQADAATNSIIITAPDAVFNNLRAVIEKLDARRAQVYVEALIAEVTADKAAEFGIQWQSLRGLGKNGATAFGGTNFGTTGQNILGLAQNPAALGAGLNIGVVNGSVTIPGTSTQILNINLLIRALQTDSRANILSTPTLLTLDNEEARIVIGQNVPFITGQYATTGTSTTPTPFQTIERQDVGVTLHVRPQISQGGTVKLQISQEVSSVQASSLTNAAGIITNKRSMESTVLAEDGQIVVIGGLIQDTVSDGVDKVPLLGDLPLVGGLFQYKNRSHSKTNLMVFLRPKILRTAQSADSLTSDRYDYVVGEEIKSKMEPGLVLPAEEQPVLPRRQAAPPPAMEGKPQ